MSAKTLRVGTRGSDLALAQTRMVLESLAHTGSIGEEHIIKTLGDKDQRPFSHISGDGFFTKELERAILSREIDMAVHSSKDLPSIVHETLPWKAYSHREDTADILIAKPSALDNAGRLKPGSHLGTSSPRREAQARQAFPGIHIEPLRGNVPTRIQRVVEGSYDAVILAKAGVSRLRLLEKTRAEGLDVRDLDFVTAPCQGIIGVQCSNDVTAELDSIANHELDDIAKAEKSVLALLGGGCHLPLGTKIEKHVNGYRLSFFLGEVRSTQAFDKHGATLGDLLRELVKALSMSPHQADKRVWLAQPIQHVLKPAQIVSHLGLEPVVFPLLEVVPVWREKDLKEFAVEQKRFGAVSFSSQFAVQLFMTELASYLDLASWFANVKVFAVGPSTKKKLAEYGISDVELAKEAHGRALAALLEKAKIRGDLLIPGQSGSLVKGRLKGFGTLTKGLTLYRMRPSRNAMSLNLPAVRKNDHIVLTSPSSAKEFVIRCQKQPELKRLNVWAFGPSTSRELDFLGVTHRVNPISGSWESVLDVIKKS